MIPTWGTSTGRNSAGGIPSLLLDFSNQSYLLNGTAFAAFGGSPGITFSRGTNATMIDSTGTLTYAPSNQFTNSESFVNITPWPRTGLSAVNSNIVAAPDGTITADKIAEDGATSAHYLGQVFSSIASVSYTCSIYVKAAERQYVQIVLVGAVASPLTAGFDLSGSGSTVTSAGTTSVITSVGDGWYRCSITANATISTAGASIQFRIATSLSTTPANYLGTDKSGLYLWGAQIGAVTYETAPRAYNNTTPKNLLGFTEEFSNAAWVKPLATVTANSIADPNGNLNADTLSATLGNATILQNISLLAAPYTFSIWLKRKTGTGNINITINGVTFVTQAVTADWARFSTTLTPSAGTKNIGVQIVTLGDEVYAWGAQVSDSASLDPYVYNPAAAPTSTAYYGPRFEYDPVTLAPLGLLIEEARTNLLLYSEQFDVAATWVGPNVTITVNDTIAPNGTTTADKIVETISATTHQITQTTAFVSGTEYTWSIFVKAAERSAVRVLFPAAAFTSNLTANFDIATGAWRTGSPTPSPALTLFSQDAGNGWYRISVTATATASVSSTILFLLLDSPSSTGSYAGNGTSGLYAWGAQIEAAGFATSYIPTVSASATRSADVATMVGNNFTNWYNETNGTISVNADTVVPSGSSSAILSFQDAASAATNRHQLSFYTACSATVLSGTVQANLGANTLQFLKSAYAYQDNNFGFSANGTTTVVDPSGTVPLSIGYATLGKWDYGAAPSLNGHIKSVSYYNTRLTDAQLQAITL